MSRPREKRRSPRAPVSIRIDYSTVDALFWDFARNINEGGVFVETDSPLPVGTKVQLKFYLPGLADPVETQGEVVWVGRGGPGQSDEDQGASRPGMGIQFTELSAENKQAINRLVQELRKG